MTRGQLLQKIYDMISGRDIRPFRRVMERYHKTKRGRQKSIDELDVAELDKLVPIIRAEHDEHKELQKQTKELK